MAQQTIDLGAAPDDGNGDSLRVGLDKANDNFTELYADKIEASTTDTLTNKSVALGGNTVTGTKAEFDAAVTDGDIIYAETTHVAVEADDHTLELIVDAAGFGDVKALEVQYDTGAINTGEDEAIVLVNINQVDALGGDIIAYDVQATDGAADNIWGLMAGAGVNPIRHQSGVFINPTLWENDGVDETSEVTGVGTSSCFVADNDAVLVTSTAKFENIEIELDTAASGAGIAPTFEFSTGGSGFTVFTPIDGTDGFRFNGLMNWDDADIPTWATNTSGNFEIRITRTQNGLGTNPVVDICQISAVTDYTWSKDGDICQRFALLREQSAAGADTAGIGQLWVKDDTPNTLQFTDDAGTDSPLLMSDIADQTIAGGANITLLDQGTKSSGTYTLDGGARPHQKITNDGAFTLAPDASESSFILDILNDSSAGTITTSGFSQVSGDAFDTTDTNRFRCHCSTVNAVSLLDVRAMQ